MCLVSQGEHECKKSDIFVVQLNPYQFSYLFCSAGQQLMTLRYFLALHKALWDNVELGAPDGDTASKHLH